MHTALSAVLSATDPPKLDTGNTAWVIAATALVLFMTPGLAFFYGGMVRVKNVLGMLMQNYIVMGIVGMLWVLVGFTLAFGPDHGGIIGDLHFAGMAHGNDITGTGIPETVFSAFQMTFAIITPALFTGSIADRMKFPAFIAIVTAWSILVYAPIAHWVWGGGWLSTKVHALDFAGGTVVHINAGVAGLALTLLLGKRIGWPKEPMKPHNVPMVMLGAGMLWFGWIGFNAGSELGADGVAGWALINSIVATCAAMLAWLAVEKIRDGHATTLGAASGLVAGLVAITPACGFVNGLGAIAIGILAGAICALCVGIKFRFGFDDSLDVVAVHLIGGVIGALAVGLFCTTTVNSAGANGLFYGGGWTQLGHQAVAVGTTLGYTFLMTIVIGLVVKAVIGLRVDRDTELQGLDAAIHAETAYELSAGIGAGIRTGSTLHSSAPLAPAAPSAPAASAAPAPAGGVH